MLAINYLLKFSKSGVLFPKKYFTIASFNEAGITPLFKKECIIPVLVEQSNPTRFNEP